MPTLICRNCDHRAFVPPERVKFGMMCPECYCQNMKPVDGGRRRSGGRDIAIRPAAIRLLIGGVLFLVAGATLAGWGLQARHPLAPRVLAYGVVMLGAGAICLAVGGFNAIRDLSDR